MSISLGLSNSIFHHQFLDSNSSSFTIVVILRFDCYLLLLVQIKHSANRTVLINKELEIVGLEQNAALSNSLMVDKELRNLDLITPLLV